MHEGHTREVDLFWPGCILIFCCLDHTWMSYRIEIRGSGIQTNHSAAIGSVTFGAFSLIHCLTLIHAQTNIVCVKSRVILIATLKGSKERRILLQIYTSSTLTFLQSGRIAAIDYKFQLLLIIKFLLVMTDTTSIITLYHSMQNKCLSSAHYSTMNGLSII
jgi:hypothetical protein